MDIEAIVNRHLDQCEKVSNWYTRENAGAEMRAALTELSAAHAIELRAYEATVENLRRRVAEQSAELERLRNRVASAERDLAVAVAEGDRIMCDWQEQVIKTCAALKQRNDAEQLCAALRKDAERYRWLRSPSVGPATVWHVCMEHMDGGLHTIKSDSCLDEAIDAAIAAEGEK